MLPLSPQRAAQFAARGTSQAEHHAGQEMGLSWEEEARGHEIRMFSLFEDYYVNPTVCARHG